MTKVIGDYDDRNMSLLAKDQYLRQVHRTPPLSETEARALLARVQRGKGPDGRFSSDALLARDRLIEGYQPLVIAIASRMVRICRVLECLDLIQEGSEGLLRAIEDAGPAMREVSAWFIVYIRHAMSRAVTYQDSVVRLTSVVRKELNCLRRAESFLSEQLHRAPTVAELASCLGMTQRKVYELRCSRNWREVESLQGLLREDENEDKRDFVSLFEQAVNEASWRSERVREAVAQALTKRQQAIVRLRYGMDEQDGREQTQVEVAACLSVTEGTVRYQERGAYRRLFPVLATACEIVEPGPVSLSCQHCGRAFARRFGEYVDNRYCSDNCRGAARRVGASQSEEVA